MNTSDQLTTPIKGSAIETLVSELAPKDRAGARDAWYYENLFFGILESKKLDILVSLKFCYLYIAESTGW